MQFIMLLLFVGLMIPFIYWAKKMLSFQYFYFEKQLEMIKISYDELSKQSENIDKQNRKLEVNVSNIVVLYEVAREISKPLKEIELFNAFKNKLTDHMSFIDCLLLDVQADIEEIKREYFVFPLKSEQRLMGYLAIKGISDETKDRFSVLMNQFALCLRRVRLYQKIEELAITDSLTLLFTRRYCLDRYKEEFQRSTKHRSDLSLLMVDIDYFKDYNDKFGHLVGDAILKEIADIIKENIREIDLAGRYGGEEFSVVLPETGKQGALLAAERIRQAVEQREIRAYNETIKITISIGVASFPEDAANPDELIDKSDWALYRAKKQGRNCVCVFGVYN